MTERLRECGMKMNTIYNEDCLETMKRMDDCFVDLTVTSPPYDNLRDYKGYIFDFKSIARELFRTTKEGGIVVWIVGDATIDGSETGTSFTQALFFMDCGLRDLRKHSLLLSELSESEEEREEWRTSDVDLIQNFHDRFDDFD